MKQIIFLTLFMTGCAKGPVAAVTAQNAFSDVSITRTSRTQLNGQPTSLTPSSETQSVSLEPTPVLDPKSQTPVITIVSSPGQNKVNLDYDFSFLITNPEAVSTTMCRINTESWKSCEKSFTGHLDRVGIQKFEVLVTSMRGEEISSVYDWTVLEEKEFQELKEKEEAKTISDQKERELRAQNNQVEEVLTQEPTQSTEPIEKPEQAETYLNQEQAQINPLLSQPVQE